MYMRFPQVGSRIEDRRLVLGPACIVAENRLMLQRLFQRSCFRAAAGVDADAAGGSTSRRIPRGGARSVRSGQERRNAREPRLILAHECACDAPQLLGVGAQCIFDAP
jgi:hypothetical protein